MSSASPSVVIPAETRGARTTRIAVVSIFAGEVPDFSDYYSEALSYSQNVDIIHNPGGAVDYSYYAGVIVSMADLWWQAEGHAQEMAAWAAFIDTGGWFVLVGQDFIFSLQGDLTFPHTYLGVVDVTEDANWGDLGLMQVEGTSGGPLQGLEWSATPCFGGFWFTDVIVPQHQGVVKWSSPLSPEFQEGGSVFNNRIIFSTVELACSGDPSLVTWLWIWARPTATETSSFSAIKNRY